MNDLDHLVLPQQVQLSADGQQLEIEGALILCQAPNRLPVAQPHGHGAICGRSATSPAAAGQNLHTAGIAQRLLDLRQSALPADVRQIRPKNAATSSDHVTIETIALPGEVTLACR